MKFATQTDFTVNRRFGIEKGLEVLAAAGYENLDFSIFCKNEEGLFTDGDIDLVKSTAERLGLTFIQAHAPFGNKIFMTDLLPLMPRVFGYCAKLGIPHVVVHPVLFDGLRYYGNEKEIIDRNVALFRSLGPIAKDCGVKIAIENNYSRHPVTNCIVDGIVADPHEMIDMFDALDDPDAFTLLLDVGHVALTNREPQDAIRVLGRDRLGGLHIHDVDYIGDLHTLPGIGKINWDEVCRALGEIDYQGVFTLESDNFLLRFEDDFYPTAVKFMAERAKYLADKAESYRIK